MGLNCSGGGDSGGGVNCGVGGEDEEGWEYIVVVVEMGKGRCKSWWL